MESILPIGLRSGCPVRRALLASLLTSTLAIAQTPPRPTAKKAITHRANELTLAELRPGRDRVAKAKTKYGSKDMTALDGVLVWNCGVLALKLDLEGKSGIRAITLSEDTSAKAKAQNPPSNEIRDIPIPCNLKQTSTALDLEQGKGFDFKNSWRTGRGLVPGQPTTKVVQLYGEPDSRSPSTKDGQPLELMYYAFDWAGPDVPQVMEVLCTKEKDGGPGRVVEITLAAPSL
jgi:hypothetical protein